MATKAKPAATKAKAEVRAAADTATKMLDSGMDQLTGFAGLFGEQATASTEVMRTLGSRNMSFFTKALEQGVETTQAMTAAKDVREVMEIQAGFAKSMFSSYTSEINAQAEIFMSALRNAAKPIMAFGAK